MPYLMCGYAVALLFMLVGCRISARTVPGLRGVRLLSWALVCGIVSVLLLASRPFAPAWITILLANQALFACSLLIYCTVAETLEVPMPFLPWGIGIGLFGLLADAWFTWPHPSLLARILLSSSLCSIYSIAAAALLFRHTDPAAENGAPALRFLARSLAWLETSMAALYFVRCILSILFPPQSFLHLDLLQAAFSYLNLLLCLAIGCGLLWFALCSHRRDLHTLARTDSLTGLLNRRAFEEILGRELRRASIEGSSLTLLLLDLDSFKLINDTFGHHAGDEVICRVSALLSAATRPVDALARYGGEEFVMLLRDLPLAQAQPVAERLRQEIAALPLPGGVSITASIGIDSSRPDDTPEQLLRRCDEALYRSKRRGRNRVTTWASAADSPSGRFLRPFNPV